MSYLLFFFIQEMIESCHTKMIRISPKVSSFKHKNLDKIGEGAFGAP